jgi:polysaccharide deacetylase 2 family uncharacterized protein YibQ
MNQFKNFVIFILSLIIVVQSVFLFYFMSGRQRPGHKEVSAKERPVGIEGKPAIPPGPVAPKPAKITGSIALVLDDWGYNLKNQNFITDNRFHVTLSILPFKVYSTEIARLANQNNKDVIVHMPMEPHNKEHYGLEENTLLSTMDNKTIVRILDSAFASVPMAKGLSNHMGSKATEDSRLMRVILEYLKNKNLFFLDSFVTNKTVCRTLAKNLHMGFLQRDVFIDNNADSNYIRAQILKLAQRAKRVGVAVGIGHDRPSTVTVLKEIIPELEAEGYRFVNLSEIVGE